jgi:signal transduction histidine kinase/ActR/RegA family two-component response regulator
MPASAEQRVLALPPTQADAAAIQKLFESRQIACDVVADVNALCRKIQEGAAAVLISEEALLAHPDVLVGCLNNQPVWSDLPVLVMSRSGAESSLLAPILGKMGQVSVVERPMRMTTLVSLVRSGIRARERQYQVRQYIVEQARAEAALRNAEHTERVARTEAERAGRIKDEFLATLSHELRTPLHAILGWSQILRKNTEMPAKASEGLSVIERNARSQAQIISDLLDMSSIISGKVRLDVQRADLANIVQAAVDTVRPAAEAKGIRLHIVLDPLARQVRGDPNRLQQVFWNLLTNAIKFTPKGGRVSVSLERVNSHLEVNFADTGEGIDAGFLPYVFDRFRQADSAIDRRHGGLGLGLSIVKQLVELHGGTISVKSGGKGLGSTFRVALPLMATIADSRDAPRSHHPTESVYREPAPDTPGANLSGFKILVVDDESDARALVRHWLEDCNAIVSTAASAEEALKILEQDPPDLLISDIGMPGEDGYRLIQRIRALGSDRARTPAIALTAYARVDDRVKAIESGYQMHLAKPVEPLELIAMAASWKRNARASVDTVPPKV